MGGLSSGTLLGLLRLGSAALPIGAFAYSQGLEQAILLGDVSDQASAEAWTSGLLDECVLGCDVPVLARLHAAFDDGDARRVRHWNDFLFASRPTKELRGEANKYSNNKMMVTDVTMTGPTDENGAPMCNGTAQTLPLAPGDWEFSAPLASGTTTCVRDIQAGGDLQITFVDGVMGCGGPEAAMPMPIDPLAPPVEGEVPADGTEPPPPTG